jgi:LPXTG-motif cell wall-anchored protein
LRRVISVLTAAFVVAVLVMVAAYPAVAQPTSTKGEIAQAKQKGKAKAKQQKAAMPPTGGISSGSVALVGLGASALLIGGGLVVRKRPR